VSAGGGQVVPVEQADGVVWGAPRDPKGLEHLLAANPRVRWVQLMQAGIERFAHLVDDDRVWSSGKGVYADPVAELALTLALAGMRGLDRYARETSWSGPRGLNLFEARVSVFGGGGITQSLLRLLRPFDCHVTVVRNRVQEMEGADVVIDADRYFDAIPGADLVVLALALTPDTEGIIAREELEAMEEHAWLVNVARGKHVATDDLVWALRTGVIGGAGLDVTDPEPLPDGHALWSLPNCIITPHVGNTPEMEVPLLSERIATNVRRQAEGKQLLGLVDPDLRY